MSDKSYVVSTNAHLRCDARKAWEKVCFYEHISIRPSWLLRAVLPVPVRTTGVYRDVGSVSRCLYSDGGHLTKRMRNIVAGERVEFDIIEQSIRYADSIALKGGTIRIEPHVDGTCSVEMLTRYELRRRWLAAARLCIDRVVKEMHKIVIRDMQVRLESRVDAPSRDVPASGRRARLSLGWRAMSRVLIPLLAWFAATSSPTPLKADEFAWELSANGSRYELEPFLETDRSSLGATYFFGGVDDSLGPYALASFLDPKTRIGVTAAREDQSSFAIGSGGETVAEIVNRTDRYGTAGRYVFPETKWYVGGRYERPELRSTDGAQSYGLVPPLEDMGQKAYGAILGKYLGPRTSIELDVNRSEVRTEGESIFCAVIFVCTIGGTQVSKQTTDDVAVSAAHVRQFRSLTYRLAGRVQQTSGDIVVHTSAFEVPVLSTPLPPSGVIAGIQVIPPGGIDVILPPGVIGLRPGPIGGFLARTVTIPAQTSETDLGTFRVYSTSGELFPTTRLGVRVGYSRWDGDRSIDDGYDVGVTWFVRRDLAVGASWQRQTNGASATLRHAKTLGIHIAGRL